jgi:geranylgeranylglycerol-phosphate geranylgeranyltransferase
MKKIRALFALGRFHNASMTAVAVGLGYWLSGALAEGRIVPMFLLAAAAVFATAFGNAVNDITDIAADRINRPGRPLPSGALSAAESAVFAGVLAAASLAASGAVSVQHCAGAAIPLALLTLYAVWLKGTPLLGNCVVSALVGYALIFGAIGAPRMDHLLLPALCAFLINVSREIIKDIEDTAGDMRAGYRTTASLPLPLLKTLIFFLGPALLYAAYLPFHLGHFGKVYLGLCLGLLLPLETARLLLFFKFNTPRRLSVISLLAKIELACGLAALAIDKL